MRIPNTRGTNVIMLNRFAPMAAACLLVPVALAPGAVAEPVPPPPPDGAVASGAPGVVTTPDGWNLTVSAANETQISVPPLTTSLGSREYLVGGVFTATVKGSGRTKLTGGVLEAGYQIGCGILVDTVRPIFGFGINPNFGTTGFTNTGIAGNGGIEVDLKPGEVTTVKVSTKTYKDTESRVSISNFRVSIDQCVGESFLRSYATLTSSTDDTDDVVTYVGVTKSV